jgi:hypothetical protein
MRGSTQTLEPTSRYTEHGGCEAIPEMVMIGWSSCALPSLPATAGGSSPCIGAFEATSISLNVGLCFRPVGSKILQSAGKAGKLEFPHA